MPTAKRRSLDQDGTPGGAPEPNHSRQSSSRQNTSRRKPKLLTREERETFIAMMRLGAPPLLGCQKLDVSFDAVLRTCDRDPNFRRQLSQTGDLLEANVSSAMYKSAMGGSVSAQSHYHRQRQNELKSDSSAADITDEVELMRLIARVSAEWVREHEQRNS